MIEQEQSHNKIKVEITYDSLYQTWNIMSPEKVCLHYGDIDSLEKWLFENRDEYEEQEDSHNSYLDKILI